MEQVLWIRVDELKWKNINKLIVKGSFINKGSEEVGTMKSEYIPNWDPSSSSIFLMMNPNSMSSFDDYFFGEFCDIDSDVLLMVHWSVAKADYNDRDQCQR